jgi:hypothetical protein
MSASVVSERHADVSCSTRDLARINSRDRTGRERFTNPVEYVSSTNRRQWHLPSSLRFLIVPAASCRYLGATALDASKIIQTRWMILRKSYAGLLSDNPAGARRV